MHFKEFKCVYLSHTQWEQQRKGDQRVMKGLGHFQRMGSQASTCQNGVYDEEIVILMNFPIR